MCFQALWETLSVQFHDFKFFLKADDIPIFISGFDFSLEVQNHIAKCLHIPIRIFNRHLKHNLIRLFMSTPHIYTHNLFFFPKLILISINYTTIHTVFQIRFKLAVPLRNHHLPQAGFSGRIG